MDLLSTTLRMFCHTNQSVLELKEARKSVARQDWIYLLTTPKTVKTDDCPQKCYGIERELTKMSSEKEKTIFPCKDERKWNADKTSNNFRPL